MFKSLEWDVTSLDSSFSLSSLQKGLCITCNNHFCFFGVCSKCNMKFTSIKLTFPYSATLDEHNKIYIFKVELFRKWLQAMNKKKLQQFSKNAFLRALKLLNRAILKILLFLICRKKFYWNHSLRKWRNLSSMLGEFCHMACTQTHRMHPLNCLIWPN